jgi:hypothetical protein
MKRHPDWQARLVAYVVPMMSAPFSPGRVDCALFAAGGVKAMTGKDFARGFRGYRTLRAGLKKLREKGFADHVALAAARLPEVTHEGQPAPAMAQVGDVAVVETEEGPALGLVQGEAVYVMGPAGLGLVPLTDPRVIRAFRVGA